jgi:hypothetical protein
MRWGGSRPGESTRRKVDHIDEKFVGLSFSDDAVNRNLDRSFSQEVRYGRLGVRVNSVTGTD